LPGADRLPRPQRRSVLRIGTEIDFRSLGGGLRSWLDVR